METVILGHMNPDMDSILGAIALEDLMTKRGVECQAYAQGKPAIDTQWALDKFGFKAPKVISSVKGRDVILVDTMNTKQLPVDIHEATIKMVVDHHNIDGIKTTGALEMWVRPVGCSSTVIKEMYDSAGIEVPKKIAALLLAAILNDTVIFKSPTSTAADTTAAKELAEIAEIKDIEAFGKQMFIVKSNLEDTPENLLFRDFKNFEIQGKKFGIGQLELVDIKSVSTKKETLIEQMKKSKEEKDLNTIILVLTDIMKKGSELLVVSDNEEMIEKAFKTTFKDNQSKWLEGVLSRKKQIIPPLMEA